jgi:chemotaxis protein histidine kinase CheA
MAIFTTEAQGHLFTISQQLLILEENSDPTSKQQALAEISRAAHTLAGAAGAAGLSAITRIARHLELLFDQWQSGKIEAQAELFDLIYHTLDSVATIMNSYDDEPTAVIDSGELCAKLLVWLPAPVNAFPGGGHPASDDPKELAGATATPGDPCRCNHPGHGGAGPDS